MNKNNLRAVQRLNLTAALSRCPQACATICGSPDFPDIKGTVTFHQTRCGVLVAAEIHGLPQKSGKCESPVFAFHIHEGGSCTGNEQDAFADVKTHYNPDECPHPFHAGDLPPLFGNGGHAFSAFLTDRFTACEITGKTVVIHQQADDFTTQPAGNAGTKIACGEIKEY